MSKKTEISSIRALAKAVKRDDRVVRGWLRDDRWPFARIAPWDKSQLAAIDAWRKSNLEQQPDDLQNEPALKGLSDERRAKVELVIERTSKIRLERELLAGKYLLRETAEADLLKRANDAKQTLQAVVNLAPRLAGRNESDLRRMLAEHVATVCGIISSEQGAAA